MVSSPSRLDVRPSVGSVVDCALSAMLHASPMDLSTELYVSTFLNGTAAKQWNALLVRASTHLCRATTWLSADIRGSLNGIVSKRNRAANELIDLLQQQGFALFPSLQQKAHSHTHEARTDPLITLECTHITMAATKQPYKKRVIDESDDSDGDDVPLSAKLNGAGAAVHNEAVAAGSAILHNVAANGDAEVRC